MNDRQNISGSSPFEQTIGFSRAVRVGSFVSVSGTAPVNPDGTSAGGDDAALQTRRCLEIVQAALAQAGAKLEDVVRTRMYLTSAADAEAVGNAHGDVFRNIRPAATMVVVAALLRPEWKIELEADAILPD